MAKKIIRKVFVNKRNNQLNVTLSRKQIKVLDPTIKFEEGLNVEIKLVRKKNGKRKK